MNCITVAKNCIKTICTSLIYWLQNLKNGEMAWLNPYHLLLQLSSSYSDRQGWDITRLHILSNY